MQLLLDYMIYDNTLYDYLIAAGIFVVGLSVIYLFKKYVLSRLKKWAATVETSIDTFLIAVTDKSLIPIIYFAIFFMSLHTLTLTEAFKHGLNSLAMILVTFFVVRAAIAAVNFGLHSYLKKSTDVEGGEKKLKGVHGLINFAIWMIALLFLLDNLGVKISAVVAGLGIGGIAVALASQAILGDLFSYFVIFFDKPFEVGDFVIIGDKMGVVEHIGIKTTRIRALGGEQMVFSNTDLTNARVHNYKKMEERRVEFKLGVVYDTTADKLRAIPKIVQAAVEKLEGTKFDRGHFFAYGNFSLNFEFVYYVTGADYNIYMDIQQDINLTIFEAFAAEGIEFAFPTQTIYMAKNKESAAVSS
jgi:small-conductance mechanosensitive channel